MKEGKKERMKEGKKERMKEGKKERMKEGKKERMKEGKNGINSKFQNSRILLTFCNRFVQGIHKLEK